MAQPLEKTDPVCPPRVPAKVVPLTAASSSSPYETQFQSTSRIESWEEHVGQAVASAVRSLGPVLDQARLVASDACSHAVGQSIDLANRVRNRAQQIKQEHPLELLCGITAGAFVLGMAVRIWRSKSS